MIKPQLQVALDSTALPQALGELRNIADSVDIIEVGTVLALAEGMQAVRILRQQYPEHTLVCDMKILDAGDTLAKMAFEQGANWVTVSAAAHIETVRSAHNVARKYQGEVQIELFGNWTLEDAKVWLACGVKQAIYHRSRDAQAAGVSWQRSDIEIMTALSDLGIELSVTGGVVPEDLHLFKDINVKVFIAGRALMNPNGIEISRRFHDAINQYW